MARVLQFEVCPVDLENRRVERNGEVGTLSTREAALLAYLADRAGEEVSHQTLLVDVWGYAPASASRAVSTTAARLRRKIERDPRRPAHLLTEHGSGFRLVLARGAGAPTNVPPVPAPVGREHDRLALRAALDAEGRVVGLSGPAGIGKSRLAHAVALDVRGSMPGGVWRVALAGRAGPGALRTAFADALVGSTGDFPRGLGATLAARGDALVWLDGADAFGSRLRELLPAWRTAAPRTRWLVTARQSLDLPGQVSVVVGPLAVPPSLNAPASLLAPYPAVALMRAIVGGQAAGDDTRALAALARAVGGVPLALELAAARVVSLGADSALEEARQGAARLLPDAVARLTAPERRALVALAASRGPCPPDALRAMAGDQAAATVDGLRRRGLITADGELLEPTRAAVGPIPDAVQRAHLGWWSRAGQTALAGDEAAVRALIPARADLQAAAEFAARTGEVDQGIAVARVLASVVERVGEAVGLERACRALLALPGCARDPELSGLLGAALCWEGEPAAAVAPREVAAASGLAGVRERAGCHLGLALLRLGRNDDAQRALEPWLRAADPVHRATAQRALGLVHREGRRFDAAIAHLTAAADGFRALGIRRLEADCRVALAPLVARHADRDIYAAALSTLQDLGDARLEARVRYASGHSALHVGDLTEARRSFTACAAALRELGDQAGSMRAELAAAMVDGALGARAVARTALWRALEVARVVGDRLAEGQALRMLGEASAAAGDPVGAERLHTAAVDVFGATAHAQQTAIALALRARVRAHAGQGDGAGQDAAQALAALPAVDARAVALGALAEVDRRAGRHHEAAAGLDEAERVLRSGVDSYELGRLLCLKATLARDRGQLATAGAAWDEAASIAAAMALPPEAPLSTALVAARPPGGDPDRAS